LTETGQYSRNLAARPDVSLAISGIAGVMIPFLVTTHRLAGSIRSESFHTGAIIVLWRWMVPGA